MKFDLDKEVKLNIFNIANLRYHLCYNRLFQAIESFSIRIYHGKTQKGTFYKIAYVYLALRHLHDICFKTNELQISTKEKE